MQEMISELIEDAIDSGAIYCNPTADIGIDVDLLAPMITAAFPPATIHPSQFVNGEPTEDGEYVVKTDKGYDTMSVEKGKKFKNYDNGQWDYWEDVKLTILQYCQLPSIP